MNKLIENIFKYKVINFKKLTDYGFIENSNNYCFSKNIADNQMQLNIRINRQGDISTEVIDLETGDPYNLFLVENAAGEFVGGIRSEYEKILTEIADKCADKQIFKSNQSKEIIDYIRTKFGGELEFLWAKFPDCAIWRKEENGKWYGAIMCVSKSKLGLNVDETVEIIDLRIDPVQIERIVDNKKYFKGYHMNKRHWVTVCLDNSVESAEICTLIDKSYNLAK